LGRPVPKARKASKDLSAPRAPSASAGRLGLRDRLGRSDHRVPRERPVARVQLDPLVNADRPDRKAPLDRPARPDRRARRVTPARHRQFASSLARIAFAAKMTKSWLVLFVRRCDRGREVRDARDGSSRSVCTSVIVAEAVAPRRVCQSGAARPLVLLGPGHRIAGLNQSP
jgi:hypothetical protein